MTIQGMLMSRRALLYGVAVSVLGAAGPAFPQSGGELFFASNGGSTQRIFEEIIIPKFTEATGIKVNYVAQQPADTVAKLKAQQGTSGLDIVWLAGATTYVAIDDGLLQAFDLSKVPNAENIDPALAVEPEVLPIAVSGNALLYNKDVFAKNGWEPPKEWLDLWDPKYAGHSGMYSTNSTGGIEMLLQVAKELTGDYNNLDPAFAKLAELDVYEFFPSAGAWETAFQQGDLWIAVNSYTRAIQMTESGLPVAAVLPASGVPSHELHVGMVKGAKNADAANAFANFLLSPEAQQLIAANLGYGPSVKDIEIEERLKPFYPAAGQAWFPNWREMAGRFDEIVERWQREVER